MSAKRNTHHPYRRALSLLLAAGLTAGSLLLAVAGASATEASDDAAIDPSFSGNPIQVERDLSAYNLPADSLYHTAEVMPDTWVFTDALGRTALTQADVGSPREDRTLAMFFWMWHTYMAEQYTPFNVQKFLDANDAAGIPYEDYIYNGEHEVWPDTFTTACFWNEPIYGYYRSDDQWVARKQVELLAAAGVDVVFSDNTNGTLLWDDGFPFILEAWEQEQKKGVDTPLVSFMLPFVPGYNTRVQLYYLYDNFYKVGKFPSMWFYWEGKPMLMAHGQTTLSDIANDSELSAYYTFRPGQPSYFTKKENYTWGWLSVYPQATHYAKNPLTGKLELEQITVGVAQNANYNTMDLAAMNGPNVMGRSYTSDRQHLGEEGSSLWGYNLAEQFEYALEKDPKVIFVTGWNEWMCTRAARWPANINAVDNGFPDTFNDEYSRDLEPTRGELGDNYYYQFVNFVRRYKGVREIPSPTTATTIQMDGSEAQWATVGPYYAANIDNIGDRNSPGYIGTHYSDYSGRNDIIGAQVARDDEYLYFHVECANDITPHTDPLWMHLYIDSDGENNGWNSFDYVVNKSAASDTTVVLEKFTGNGYETVKVSDCAYTQNGRYMTVQIPKADLGIQGYDFTVNFAWTDNVHDVADTGTGEGENTVYSTFSGDILDFYTSGDVAPGGRFKYSYISTTENAGVTVEETTAESTTQSDPNESSAITTESEESTAVASSSGCGSLLSGGWVATLTLGAARILSVKRKGKRT